MSARPGHADRDGSLKGASMDRAKHGRSQGELRKAVTWFGPVVDHAVDALFVQDDSGVIVDVNRQACKSLGYAAGEIVGSTPALFDPGLYRDEAFRQRNRERLDAGEIVSFETWHRRRDGTTFPVEVRIRRFWEGDRHYALSSARDITEHKRAEAERRAHLWFLESMDRINRAVQGPGDLEAVASVVLGELIGIFACECAWLVHPCDPEAVAWRVVVQRTAQGSGGTATSPDDRPIDAAAATAFAAARDADGPVLYEPGAGLADDPAHRLRPQLAIALRPKLGDRYLLVLDPWPGTRAWTTEERRLFQEIGRRFADALTSLVTIGSLRDSERRLEAAQRLAHVGWWVRDFRSKQVSLSDESCRIFGVEAVALPQWQDRWLSLIHPDDRAKAAAASEAALQGEVRYDVEYRVVRPDGSERVVHSRGDVTRDELGRPVRQFGVMQDITDLRKAEDERRASEARFRTFVDHAADGFFVLDARLAVVDVNRQACQSLGYGREELIGMHPRDFDAGLDEPSIGRLVNRADAGETLTFETLHRRKDGSMFPVEIRTHRFGQAGEPVYLCLVRDIGERRRAEEELRATEARFRTLVDSAADAFMLHAPDGTVIDVNLQACDSLGYTRDELIGMMPGQFDADLDPEVLKQVVARVGTGEPFTFETRHRRKDGTLFPVEVRARQIWQADSWYGISMSRDITERKRAEQERERLRQLETELARVNRVTALGELAASIAHEVNQPLGAMVANAAACERWLAARPPATQKARRVLQAISADGQRAGEVIGRIRGLMKRQQPRMAALDVNEAIRDVIALAQQEMSRHAIVLATHAAEGLPAVQADRVQLQQVLLNLVINAIEAMSGIDDRARALTIASSADDSRVVVEVRDSGTGLEPQRTEQLFEAFYSTKPQGLGIGLSISRSIVETHGGRLWAELNAPHGAVFAFSLPVGS